MHDVQPRFRPEKVQRTKDSQGGLANRADGGGDVTQIRGVRTLNVMGKLALMEIRDSMAAIDAQRFSTEIAEIDNTLKAELLKKENEPKYDGKKVKFRGFEPLKRV